MLLSLNSVRMPFPVLVRVPLPVVIGLSMSVFEAPPTVRFLPLPEMPVAFVRRSIPAADVIKVSPARVTVPEAVMALLLVFDNNAPLVVVVPVPLRIRFSATVDVAGKNNSKVAPAKTVVSPVVVPKPLFVIRVKTPCWI